MPCFKEGIGASEVSKSVGNDTGERGKCKPRIAGWASVLKVKKIILWRYVLWQICMALNMNEPTVLSRKVIETFRSYTKYSLNISLFYHLSSLSENSLVTTSDQDPSS